MKRFLPGLLPGIALTALTAVTFLAAFQSRAESPKPKPAAKLATFAGGCFWCMEGPFDKLDGVFATTSGYTGGKTKDPTYEEVSSGSTGHTEAVQIAYDPTKITYEKLLDVFWRNIDPVSPNGQFCDRGNQYRPGVFVHDAEQRKAAETSRAALEKSGRFGAKIPVEITDATTFYAAEEYHQNYYEKNPIRYKFYRSRCGRDERLKELWGEPAKK